MNQNEVIGGDYSTVVRVALPVCLGYWALGFACGMLAAKAGLLPVQVFLLSVLLYAGGAQFMVANLLMSGIPALAIASSIVLMNARHMLYGSALAQYFIGKRKTDIVLFGLELTDESFGVNQNRFQQGNWPVKKARAVNTLSHLCWILANMVGVYVGCLVSLPLNVIAFSMTSMFICLLSMQSHNARTICAALTAAAVVIACKLLGLSWVGILLGSLCGIGAGLLVPDKRGDKHAVA